jgi:glycosyltransferase involved in cell wall biosynthesis
MRIVQLTPGTGNFFCGSCLRDNALAVALRALGHDVLIAPLYLPFVLEEEEPRAEGAEASVHMGGINVYLQQKLPFLRHLPRAAARLLDSPKLLRWAAGRANMTGASSLGEMTLSMLRGEEGRQAAELEKLVEWLDEIERPDVVILSNAMLAGLTHRIVERLQRPVLCTLQGEAPFLDSLPDSHRERCWSTLAERARELDGFLAVSRYTGDLMRERLGLDPAKVHVVPNGIELDGLEPRERPADAPPTIGYLARLCADKGIELLVDAYLRVRERGRVPGVRLHAAGVVLGEDRQLVASLAARMRAAGAGGDFVFRENLTRAEKIEHLQGLDVLSVPAHYGESFGLYLIEGLACGVPFVQPQHAAFPEIAAATGGGLLCEPNDPEALAVALEELLLQPEHARSLGAAGRAAVLERYTAERMARDVLDVCRMTAPRASAS